MPYSKDYIRGLAGTLHTGFIVDCDPGKNNYGVRIPNLGVFRAYGGSALAFYAPGSAYSDSAFPVGAKVLVYFPPEWPAYAASIVIGLPPGGILHDELTVTIPGYYSWPPRLSYDWREYVEDRGALTPSIEGTNRYASPNQEGMIFPSGVQLSVNFFRALIRAGEKAGIEAHLIDNFLKILGFNYAFYSSGMIETGSMEEGEYNILQMLTPYAWEAKTGALDTWNQQSGSYRVVPRYVKLFGYQGDLIREFIQVPNIYHSYGPGGEVVSGITEKPGYGVLDIQKGMDGFYKLWSAKGVEIGKRGLMPALQKVLEEPNYRYHPDDGPSHTDYKPAGIAFTAWDALEDYYSIPTGTISEREYYTVIYLTYEGAGEDLYGNYSHGFLGAQSIISNNEAIARDVERTKSISLHPAWQFASAPAFSNSVGWLQIDHRAYVRYNSNIGFLGVKEDGSIILQSGTGATASKLVLHPTEGAYLVAPNVAAIASGETDDGHLLLGGRSTHVSSNEVTQIASGGITELWGDSVIAEGLTKGSLAAERSQEIVNVTIRIYSNDGTGWTEETNVSTTNDGQHTIDASAWSLAGKVFKARVEFTVEQDDEGNNITEYIESNMFFQGGSGSVGIKFSLDGGAYADSIDIPSTAKVGSMAYNGQDGDGNLQIDVTSECYRV